MGRWKAFIPIALALIIATGGSVFLYSWLQGKSTPSEYDIPENVALEVIEDIAVWITREG